MWATLIFTLTRKRVQPTLFISTLIELFSVITNEPIEFEKYPVEVQDFNKITDHFRKIYGIYVEFSIEKQLELETLRFSTDCVQKSPRTLIATLNTFSSNKYCKVHQSSTAVRKGRRILIEVRASEATNFERGDGGSLARHVVREAGACEVEASTSDKKNKGVCIR